MNPASRIFRLMLVLMVLNSVPSDSASAQSGLILTNAVLLPDGRGQFEVRVPSNGVYTLLTSADLKKWDAGMALPDNTNRMVITSPDPMSQYGNLFIRVAAGRVPSYNLFFAFYSTPGSWIGTAGSKTYPASISTSTALMEVENADAILPASDVFFTGPTGSGLSHAVVPGQGGQPADHKAWYQIPVPGGASTMAGNWTVNYGTNVFTFNKPDPQVSAQFVVVMPAVNVSNDVVTSVSWVYLDPLTGTLLGNTPASIEDLTIEFYVTTGASTSLAYKTTGISPDSRSHVLTSTVLWSQVSGLDMDFDDTMGNYYSVTYGK